MRIVGGETRGRRLVSPATLSIRPTSDRLRETLFDILLHRYSDPVTGARVLDLFAGTGALGLEALSRGADFALFVEEDATARGLIRRNIETVGATGTTKVYRRDATRLGALSGLAPFSLVFADPPYAKGLGERALSAALGGGWLTPEALCILEERRSAEIAEIEGLEVCETRPVGESQLVFLKRL
ncbi:16S rRNA (guanine(966)-N(2))-methyltransferase RsmD [Bauldia sp.]|uniref:16S rRNA (guanine(966)-N(2))-methyltransferase RsmD n=1 Tax=Bauldia sp. TaxID=2575872 RepID=UPI003BAB6285